MQAWLHGMVIHFPLWIHHGAGYGKYGLTSSNKNLTWMVQQFRRKWKLVVVSHSDEQVLQRNALCSFQAFTIQAFSIDVTFSDLPTGTDQSWSFSVQIQNAAAENHIVIQG
ncbi:Uncharacterized protein Fot_54345 [Forsythia ovata]|uniref:Uncharacterized protein n=1 Tax=Forsythia ovata TaxID=205694 RepID=A0ABD1PGS3_9LAMI